MHGPLAPPPFDSCYLAMTLCAAGIPSVVGIVLLAVCAPTAAQTVEGTVLERGTSVPIRAADIALTNETTGRVLRAISDSAGRFSLDIPEAGVYRLGAVRLGYVSFASDRFFVSEGQTVKADLLLEVEPIELDPVSVVAEGAQVPALRRVGFYQRMERGFGHFLVREAIEARRPQRVTDLFRQLPGVQVVAVGDVGAEDVIMRAGRSMYIKANAAVCYPSISIDGQLIRAGGVPSRDREVGTWGQILHPNDVEAVEIYPGAAGLPVQLAGSVSPCGAILIWTTG